MEPELNRIGVLGLERLVEVGKPHGTVVLIPRIDVFLEVAKGSSNDHAFQLKVNEIIDKGLAGKVVSMEDLCVEVMRGLLTCFNPRSAEVRMEAEYAVYRRTPRSGQKTQEMYKILARAKGSGGIVRKTVGAEVTGLNVCPCAQEGLREYTKARLRWLPERVVTKVLGQVPLASHNQRNVSRLLLEAPEGYRVEVEELIAVLEEAMSSPLYELLKREDEVEVVLRSHERPSFVEDIVRNIFLSVVRRYKDLPDDCLVSVRSESMESIHQHNAIAEKISYLKELRAVR